MDSTTESELSAAMTKRYAPFVDWRSIVDESALTKTSVECYWRTPQQVAALRTDKDRPLQGLRLLLDTGHVGGQWAAHEDREFRIKKTDFYIREAELNLIVAKNVRTQLIQLGAEVILLREEAIPSNPRRPVDYLPYLIEQIPFPEEPTPEGLKDYADTLRAKALRLALVTGELMERARIVNDLIRPDALISIHLNAAAWPGTAADGSAAELQLVDSNDLHVLIFGCMEAVELKSAEQQACLIYQVEQWQWRSRAIAG